MSQAHDSEHEEIADAARFLESTGEKQAGPQTPVPDADLGTYDLDGGTAPGTKVIRNRVPPPSPQPADLPRIRLEKGGVTQVWSRSAEWSADLLRLGIFAGVMVVFIYCLAATGHWIAAFLTLLVGIVVAGCLAYPLIITLERPVRMTPDRAVRDYLAALSHSFPHYRRMWLLLSDKGRSSDGIQSEADLRRYWQPFRRELRKSGRPWHPALLFDLTAYEGEKPAGKASVEAKLTIQVRKSTTDGSLRPAIAEFRYPTTLTRGPDNQWYLDAATIPRNT
jgi:hypothetical protein